MSEPIKFNMKPLWEGGAIKESDMVTFAPEIEEEIMRGIKLRREMDQRPLVMVDAVAQAAKDFRDMDKWPRIKVVDSPPVPLAGFTEFRKEHGKDFPT